MKRIKNLAVILMVIAAIVGSAMIATAGAGVVTINDVSVKYIKHDKAKVTIDVTVPSLPRTLFFSINKASSQEEVVLFKRDATGVSMKIVYTMDNVVPGNYVVNIWDLNNGGYIASQEFSIPFCPKGK